MPFFLEEDKNKSWFERNGELVWGALGLSFFIFFLTMMINAFYIFAGACLLGFLWSGYRLEMFRRSQGINSMRTSSEGDDAQPLNLDLSDFGGGDV